MGKKIRQTENVFHSMMEFEKKFFPKSHEEKLAQRRSKEPGTFGTGLAVDLLDGIRQELTKRTTPH